VALLPGSRIMMTSGGEGRGGGEQGGGERTLVPVVEVYMYNTPFTPTCSTCLNVV